MRFLSNTLMPFRQSPLVAVHQPSQVKKQQAVISIKDTRVPNQFEILQKGNTLFCTAQVFAAKHKHTALGHLRTYATAHNADGAPPELPTPRPNGWSSDFKKQETTSEPGRVRALCFDSFTSKAYSKRRRMTRYHWSYRRTRLLLSKNSEKWYRNSCAAQQVDRALQLQTTVVKRLYKSLDEVADGDKEPADLVGSFKQDARFASKIGAYSYWPFAPVPDSGKENTLTFQNDLPHLLKKAYYTGRLALLLPLLHSLFAVLPACSTALSPHLLAVLHTLADLQRDRDTPRSCMPRLEQMLLVWLQPLQQATASKPVYATPPATISSAGNVQQQQRQLGSNSSASAVQSTTVSPHEDAEISNSAQAQKPQLPMTMSPEYISVAYSDDLSPKAWLAYNLLASAPDAEPLQVHRSELWLSQRELLHKMGGGPHGKYALREYARRHTNTYSFDFNQVMSERRRKAREQEASAGQAVPEPDLLTTSSVLSPAFDLGFEGSSSHCGTNNAHQADEEYYL